MNAAAAFHLGRSSPATVPATIGVGEAAMVNSPRGPASPASLASTNWRMAAPAAPPSVAIKIKNKKRLIRTSYRIETGDKTKPTREPPTRQRRGRYASSMAEMATLTFDALDARRLAEFWAAVFGWDFHPDATAEFAMVGGPRRPHNAPSLMFIQVPEDKVAKNRMHLDLTADDLEQEVERLVGLGATVIHEKDEWDTRWFTLQDPEGNEFCVSQPHDAA